MMENEPQLAENVEVTAPPDAEPEGDPTPVPVEVAEEVTETPSEVIEPYKVGTWGQYANYSCNFCEYNSLREAQVQQHYETTHKPKTTVLLSQLVDSQGRRLQMPGG